MLIAFTASFFEFFFTLHGDFLKRFQTVRYKGWCNNGQSRFPFFGQSLKFKAPVRPGDRVRAEVTVREIDYAKRRVTLDCLCSIKDKPVLTGEALVLAPSARFD